MMLKFFSSRRLNCRVDVVSSTGTPFFSHLNSNISYSLISLFKLNSLMTQSKFTLLPKSAAIVFGDTETLRSTKSSVLSFSPEFSVRSDELKS